MVSEREIVDNKFFKSSVLPFQSWIEKLLGVIISHREMLQGKSFTKPLSNRSIHVEFQRTLLNIYSVYIDLRCFWTVLRLALATARRCR